jgi:hypothetical protein
VGLTGKTETGTAGIAVEVMITIGDTTEGMIEAMTMIEDMTAEMIVVTMISGMSAITIVIVTIETTDPH